MLNIFFIKLIILCNNRKTTEIRLFADKCVCGCVSLSAEPLTESVCTVYISLKKKRHAPYI